jgi:polyhydroxyalkanoate synthesis regulator phasin
VNVSEDERRPPDLGEGLREGVRTLTGVLGAFAEAIEQTFGELRETGDLSSERAREAARTTVQRAQEAVDGLRERLDLVPRREFEVLRDEVAALRSEIDDLRARAEYARPDADPPATEPSEGGGAGGSGGGFPIDDG